MWTSHGQYYKYPEPHDSEQPILNNLNPRRSFENYCPRSINPRKETSIIYASTKYGTKKVLQRFLCRCCTLFFWSVICNKDLLYVFSSRKHVLLPGKKHAGNVCYTLTIAERPANVTISRHSLCIAIKFQLCSWAHVHSPTPPPASNRCERHSFWRFWTDYSTQGGGGRGSNLNDRIVEGVCRPKSRMWRIHFIKQDFKGAETT